DNGDDGALGLGDVDTVVRFTVPVGATVVDMWPRAGFMWSTNPANYPFDIEINGERMTVTACADLVPGLQRLTVVRAVNGVEKEHVFGDPIEIVDTAVLAW